MIQYFQVDYGVNTGLVTTIALFHAAVDHSLMRNGARETLVIHHNGHVRQFLVQAIDKRRDILHALAGLPVELRGQADDNALHLFTRDIALNELQEFMGRNRSEIASHDLQRISNRQASAFAAVVDAQNAPHRPQQ